MSVDVGGDSVPEYINGNENWNATPLDITGAVSAFLGQATPNITDGYGNHSLMKFRLSLVNSWSIEEDQLGLLHILDTEDPIARGLRFWRDDGHFVAEKGVEQGRFSHVGPSKNGNKNGPKKCHLLLPHNEINCVRTRRYGRFSEMLPQIK
jgi:hypothetical protein